MPVSSWRHPPLIRRGGNSATITIQPPVQLGHGRPSNGLGGFSGLPLASAMRCWSALRMVLIADRRQRLERKP